MTATTTPPVTVERRRGRGSLRRSVAVTFISVALLAVLLLGALNYIQARTLLSEAVEQQLTSLQAERVRALSDGIDRIEASVPVIARSQAVVTAAAAFGDAVAAMDGEDGLVAPGVDAALADFYADIGRRIDEAGIDVDASALEPTGQAARYLQYQYTLDDPLGLGPSDTAGSRAYAKAHDEFDPALDNLRSNLGFGDLLLVDTEGRVVFSTDARIDLGTNLVSGPFSQSSLAEAVAVKLPAAPTGQTVIADFQPYLPAAASPTMFVAAVVRSDTEVIGAVAMEVPVATINDLMTAGGEWAAAGMGTTGESYVVGSDNLFRSDPRSLLEDPASYVADIDRLGYASDVVSFVETFGTAVSVQPVDTEAVEAVLDGETFVGRTRNYLDRGTLAVAGSAGLAQVDWVVVAELGAEEADASLGAYVRRLLIVAAILLPLVGLVGLFLADRITRPVAPVVAGASRIAGGALDTTLPDLGRNEFGDVARRLNTIAADLHAQDVALADEEAEITSLLLSALPPRVVAEFQAAGSGTGDLVDTTTVVVVRIGGLFGQAGLDPEAALEVSSQLSADLEAAGSELGLERVRSSSDQHVFAAGLVCDGVEADVAARFAVVVDQVCRDLFHATGVDISFRIGIASGDVVARVLAGENLMYGMFGDPPKFALALADLAEAGQILVAPSAADALGDAWAVAPVTGLVDLRGERIEAFELRPPAATDSTTT